MPKLNYKKVNIELLIKYNNITSQRERKELEDYLIRLNEKMVHKKAHQWSKQKNIPIPFDELQQLAYVGLLKAIRKFDPSLDYQFSTFAYRHIDGAIMRHIRDRVSFIRIPQTLQGKGEGKVPVGSIKIISLDHEDSLLQIERTYDRLSTNESIEHLLVECQLSHRPRIDRLRTVFISKANELIDKGLINAEKIKGDSRLCDGSELLQMSLL